MTSAAPGAKPAIKSILETCVYVRDIERAAQFYEYLFEFPRLASDRRFCAFDVAGRGVLLLFVQGGTLEPVSLAGGVIPPHDGIAGGHFALAISAEDLAAWEERLAASGIAIESRVRWERGGQSVYFRDPDENLVELATPGLWVGY